MQVLAYSVLLCGKHRCTFLVRAPDGGNRKRHVRQICCRITILAGKLSEVSADMLSFGGTEVTQSQPSMRGL